MRRNKKCMACFLAFMMLTALATGCGSKQTASTTETSNTETQNSSTSTISAQNSEALPETSENTDSSEGSEESEVEIRYVSFKEFLDEGPRVMIHGKKPDKTGVIEEMYLAEDNKIYFVNLTDDLTWGDIAKMTEEELVAFAEAHKVLHGKIDGYALRCEENDPALDWELIKAEYEEQDSMVGRATVMPYPDDNFGLDGQGGVYVGYIPSIMAADVDEYELTVISPGIGDDNMYSVFVDSNGNVLHIGQIYENDKEIVLNTEDICPLPKMTEVEHYSEVITGDYKLHIITDASGNNANIERIETQRYESVGRYEVELQPRYLVQFGDGQGTKPYEVFDVYDAHFFQMSSWDYIRIPEGVIITFDDVKTDGVLVD